MNSLIIRATSLSILLTLSACGGGGGGVTGGGGTGGVWQPGVFMPSASYINKCEVPRAGNDPFTGQPYPDTQGATLDENNFLRSYSDETYLWYNEITDRNPANYNDTLDYFDLLRTTATTASGQDKDKFHFTYDTDVWNQLSQGGVSAGFGITWAFISNTPPRELRIAFVEPNTPASNIATPLARGGTILEIDGVDISDNTQAGIDVLNAGLFPDGPGETHTFRVQDVGAPGSRVVTLTSATITSDPVQNIDVINTATGPVGYMIFNDHIATAEQSLIDAVDQLNAHNGGQGITDLVLDLRYNGGGYLAIASELSYMIAGNAATAGRTFEEMQFNDKHPATNPVTGQPLSPTPFYSRAIGAPFNGTAGEALPTLDLPRVFVLTGGGTCSASEAIINGLRGIGVEVIQIGSTSCGKPYGFYAADNCGTTYFTIQFRGVNEANFGDYTDGFSPANTPAGQAGEVIPGCSVADDFDKALGDVTEGRLATALAYRDGAACPAATGVAPGVLSKTSGPAGIEDVYVPKSPWHKNRILLPE